MPESIGNLFSLTTLNLNENPLIDLPEAKKLPKLKVFEFLNLYLDSKYFTKLSKWQSKWILDEDNAEVRRFLIQSLGYEKICQDLQAIQLDDWREYNLLKINDFERLYNKNGKEEVGREPMVLLKMTCPSTGHIHILRVPPEMTSAEAAITWVNHGIHPDKFTVQT